MQVMWTGDAKKKKIVRQDDENSGHNAETMAILINPLKKHGGNWKLCVILCLVMAAARWKLWVTILPSCGATVWIADI